MKFINALLALFLASAAFASGTHVVPLGPTTKSEIEVHYLSPCYPSNGHSVTRNGSLIRITALGVQCPIVLPIPLAITARVPGLLPVGEYRAEVRMQGSEDLHTSTEFIVRDASPRPFEVHPFAVLADGSADLPIRLSISGVTCDEEDCSDLTVRVDDQVVDFTVTLDGALEFIAPDHAPGFADVSVQKDDFVTLSENALYFFEDRDQSVFESVLFPVLFSSDGAHGSQWRSEAVIANPRPWYVENASSLGPLSPCVTYPCGERIDPKSAVHLSGGFPRGGVLFVPRPEAPDLSFSLRIRDVSRHDTTLGTRVPVVREHQMFHGTDIWLLDVPLDPRYRVKLRIYAIEPVIAPALNGSVVIQRGAERLQLPFTLTRTNENEPYYAEVDLPQGVASERVNVQVMLPLDAIGWAFASVTNNDTQQVTVVAPR